jgi:hypothetical protein
VALSFLLLCSIFSFAGPADAQSSITPDSSRTQDVAESALRYFTADNHPGFGARVICFSTAMMLPMNFINRFRNGSDPVVWSTDCLRDAWGGMHYRKNNAPGVLVEISGIRWISGEDAEVTGFCRWGDFVPAPTKIHVIQKNGTWIVKRQGNIRVP